MATNPPPLIERQKDHNITHEDLLEYQQQLKEHFDERVDELIELIKSGFPEGDPAAHRRVHEGYIKEAAARDELKSKIIEKIITGGVWGGLIFVGTLVWEYVKGEAKR